VRLDIIGKILSSSCGFSPKGATHFAKKTSLIARAQLCASSAPLVFQDLIETKIRVDKEIRRRRFLA